jgi:hypothetical protein
MRPLKPGALRASLHRLTHGRALREGRPVVLSCAVGTWARDEPQV